MCARCQPNKSWIDQGRKFNNNYIHKSQPNKWWNDQGSEYHNNLMQKWEDNNILMYSTHNEGKPISAEGFRRTMLHLEEQLHL